MPKTTHVASAITIAVVSGLLVAAIISTVLLATFSYGRQANTTLTFAGNVTIEVSGVDSNHIWLASSSSNSSIINDATITAPAYNAIGIKVTKGPQTNVDVYVRVFAIVYTTYSSIQPMSVVAGTTTTQYTAQEQRLINSVPSSHYSVVCSVIRYDAIQTSFQNIISQYYPLGNSLDNSHLGASMQGLVVITAKNHTIGAPSVTLDEWNQIMPDAEYPTW